MHDAEDKNRKTVAELSLASTAEVNAKDGDGMTPLYYAASNEGADQANSNAQASPGSSFSWGRGDVRMCGRDQTKRLT